MSRSALVIGLGSIGTRHIRVLEALGLSVSAVSRREAGPQRKTYRTLTEALANDSFDYVVIATETAHHESALKELASQKYAGRVLVEKPLFAQPAALPSGSFQAAGVGYNLRFDPLVQALRSRLAGRHVQMAEFQVGQWLGDWRPGRDTARSYSASKAGGGGVLRDLSHELDLIAWLFGPWRAVTAVGGRVSEVTVDSDDCWGILLTCERCPVVALQINYLDRIGQRNISVQTDGQTFHANLVAGSLMHDGQAQTFARERDASYLAMHRSALADMRDVCTLEDGLGIVELIAAIERAGHERIWIERERR